MLSPFDSTILITGGTTGLGYEAALEIARQRPSAKIVIAARSKGDEAAAAINRAAGHSNVEYKRLDLGSLEAIREFASEFAKPNSSYPPISALVLNASLQVVSGVTHTTEGFETTFGVNHVGHALLFHLLAPHLAPKARVVVTASGTHDPKQPTGMPDPEYQSAEAVAHPTGELAKNGQKRYATSKLCNVLWMYALERKRTAEHKEPAFTINAFDPGLMPGTHLARDNPAILRFLWYKVLPHIVPFLRLVINHNVHTTRESGANLARLAVGEDLQSVSGKYFEGSKPIASSEDSHITGKQDDLFEWTVKAVAKDAEERESFSHLG